MEEGGLRLAYYSTVGSARLKYSIAFAVALRVTKEPENSRMPSAARDTTSVTASRFSQVRDVSKVGAQYGQASAVDTDHSERIRR